MTETRKLLERYMRQTAELGGGEIYLDTMTPKELLDGLLARMEGREVGAAASGAAAAMSAVAAMSGVAPTINSPLPLLAQRAAVCQLCRLWEGRTHAVFGEGSATADLLVVGEAPGEAEDRTGRPFVGRAGKLLDLLLLTAGFPREAVYICNVLKCRPPGNRNPLPDEVGMCTTNYLFPQLDAIAPKAILAVGKFAAQSLLNTEESISRLRGTTHNYRGTPLIVTYHPAYLLRSPQMTRAAWEDYQRARKVLDGQV
ncbi:MAG: uracil-DNA glycosylase [Longimicrobiales bacterium]